MSDMKIALSVVGISHAEIADRTRRWDQCLSNIQETIIDPFKSVGSVKTYITTYDHQYIQPLLEFFNPEKYLVSDITGSNQLDTYINSLSLLLDEDIDIVVTTRFDILFSKPITDLGMHYDKFNVLFAEDGWTHLNFTCDNLFVFPRRMLYSFITAIKQWKVNKPFPHTSVYGLHGVFREMELLVGCDQVNIVSNKVQRCHNNEYYFLPTVPRN